VIIAPGGTYGSIDKLSQILLTGGPELILNNNTIYGDFKVSVDKKMLSWQQFQTGQNEKGSKLIAKIPSDNELIRIARQLLNF